MSSAENSFESVDSAYSHRYTSSQPKSRCAWPGSLNGTHAMPFLELLKLARIGCEATPDGASTLSALMKQLHVSSEAGQYISSEEMLYHVTIVRDDLARQEQRQVDLPRSSPKTDALLKVRADTLLLEDEIMSAALSLWKATTKIFASYMAEEEGKQVLTTSLIASTNEQQFVLPNIPAVNQCSEAPSDGRTSTGQQLTLAQTPFGLEPEYMSLLNQLVPPPATNAVAFGTSSDYTMEDFIRDLSNPFYSEKMLPGIETGDVVQQSPYSASPPRGCWPFSIVLSQILYVKKVLSVPRMFHELKAAPKEPLTLACLLLYIMVQEEPSHKGRSLCYTMLSDVTPDLALQYSRDEQGQLMIGLMDPAHPFNVIRQTKLGWDYKGKGFRSPQVP
ncbi:hypothetical protein CF326_g4480 [Tilletia indica]|uniref:Uncharacterized protein n=1 Tax=Tilletia indica TaxID=43049 RepID=A0A177TNM0_9BASI|nr:hypothetical protein CF326_g4480 [Tilletia indica]KAE8244557.1 hypothetical protein A4X13_0g6495 [Tilletia indica]